MDSDERISDVIAQQAAQWWLMQRDGQMTDAARESFVAWLRRSPAHVESYLSTAVASQNLRDAAHSCASEEGELIAAALAAPDSVTNLVGSVPSGSARERAARADELRSSWWRRRWIFAAAPMALALVAVVVAFVFRDGQRFGIPRTYETAHAQQGSWPLPDGSVLHLNSDSRAVVRYGSGERLIGVERGQAMFQVAKDPQRRFRVDAGPAQIIAIGTEFDVYRRESGTRVVVLEGQVAVVRDYVELGTATLAIAGATPVAAGEQVDVQPTTKTVAARPANLKRARAWLQREIVFDDVPLAQVVEDFNRYTNVPLEVDGDELRALQISGVFGAYDLESFLAFLRRLEGVQVEQGPHKIRIYLMPLPARNGMPIEAARPNAGLEQAASVPAASPFVV